MGDIKKSIINFIHDPYNPLINFEQGYLYEQAGQLAASFSFYMRCAEFSRDDVIACEALLRASYCINKQGGRDTKELHCIQHALSVCRTDAEPYYVLSLFHSWRNHWVSAYTQVCIALSSNCNFNTFIKQKRCLNKETLLFQKARCAVKIGKFNEARSIYVQFLQSGKRKDVLSSFKKLPAPAHPMIRYDRSKTLRVPLDISRNFLLFYQDIFVLTMCNAKKGGSYLEIGSDHYKHGNNTFLLEKEYGWRGISIDIHSPSVSVFNSRRENICVCADARTVDYMNLLQEMPTNIDYLQLDCDPPNITFDILQKIPFDTYTFGVITYEHDYYDDITGSFREKSRKFLNSKGYVLVAGNISPYMDKYPFEDWWIHPDIVDKTIYSPFLREDDSPIFGEDYMCTLGASFNKPIPSVMVFDNFYKTPMAVREYALKQIYQNPENHGAVGFRCEAGRKIFKGTKDYFEKLLGKKIPNGDGHGQWGYSTNGCFQWCPSGTPLVYHADSQAYAGIIYLTPDPPPQCGTSFFRHKKYKSMVGSDVFCHDDWHDPSFVGEIHTDPSPWEKVDSIGNVFNRLVLFKSSNIHAVTEYFGETIHDSRLFQLFFFDLD